MSITRSQASLTCFRDLLKINTQFVIIKSSTRQKILKFTKLFHHRTETINWLLKLFVPSWVFVIFFNIKSQEDKMKDLNAYQKLLPDINHMPLCVHRTICFLHVLPRPSFIRQCFPFSNPPAFIEVSWLLFVCVSPFFFFGFFFYWGEMCLRRSNMLPAILWSAAWLTFKRTFPWRQWGLIVIGDKKIA